MDDSIGSHWHFQEAIDINWAVLDLNSVLVHFGAFYKFAASVVALWNQSSFKSGVTVNS